MLVIAGLLYPCVPACTHVLHDWHTVGVAGSSIRAIAVWTVLAVAKTRGWVIRVVRLRHAARWWRDIAHVGLAGSRVGRRSVGRPSLHSGLVHTRNGCLPEVTDLVAAHGVRPLVQHGIAAVTVAAFSRSCTSVWVASRVRELALRVATRQRRRHLP